MLPISEPKLTQDSPQPRESCVLRKLIYPKHNCLLDCQSRHHETVLTLLGLKGSWQCQEGLWAHGLLSKGSMSKGLLGCLFMSQRVRAPLLFATYMFIIIEIKGIFLLSQHLLRTQLCPNTVSWWKGHTLSSSLLTPAPKAPATDFLPLSEQWLSPVG